MATVGQATQIVSSSRALLAYFTNASYCEQEDTC
jgi:hypothetical protein